MDEVRRMAGDLTKAIRRCFGQEPAKHARHAEALKKLADIFSLEVGEGERKLAVESAWAAQRRIDMIHPVGQRGQGDIEGWR